MFVEQLRQQTGKAWPAIAKAAAAAAAQLAKIGDLVRQPAGANREGSIDSEDVSVVVFGSLARKEWTAGSDLDWTLLIDGEADQGHALTAQELANRLEQAGFKGPGRTGVFGNLAFSHSIIHQIGGQDDSNRNTTQRMLLLLESCAVNHSEAYKRVVRGILLRYLWNDYRGRPLKVPRFLLNDVHRYWRTMCVDYASKYRERAAEGWALRNVKLRTSRKLLFAAGLITCYSCDPEWVAERDSELASNPSVEGMAEYLEAFVRRPPLDILAEVLLKQAKPETAVELLDLYDAFLAHIDDPDLRSHLEQLRPDDAASDQRYKKMQLDCSRL
jgi:hypothetical protein